MRYTFTMTTCPRKASLLVLAFLCPFLLAFDASRPYERGDFAPPGDTREDRISNLEQRSDAQGLSAERRFGAYDGHADGASAGAPGLLRADPNERPKFTPEEAAWLGCKMEKRRDCGRMP